MTQNVREHLSSYIEPSAHKDWRDRSKQSLLHILSVHMDHHCLSALLTCTCTTNHCFHWNALGQGLRPRHRTSRRVAAATRRGRPEHNPLNTDHVQLQCHTLKREINVLETMFITMNPKRSS